MWPGFSLPGTDSDLEFTFKFDISWALNVACVEWLQMTGDTR